MLFNQIISNPPYDKNLHLKIVEQSIPMLTDDGILVNLSPIRWLQDPLAKYKKTSDWYKFKEIRSRLLSLLVIDSQEAPLMFSNEMTANLGVYVINNKCNKPYEGEWTDEDFRVYFGITDSEWEEIVETMKPYL